MSPMPKEAARLLPAAMHQLYKYVWGNNSKRKILKGRKCFIVAVLKANSVVVEFTDDNQREVISRRAIRRITSHADKSDR